jgi:hypothetical protein
LQALFLEVSGRTITAEDEWEFQQTMNASKGGVKRGKGRDVGDTSDVCVRFNNPISRDNVEELIGDVDITELSNSDLEIDDEAADAGGAGGGVDQDTAGGVTAALCAAALDVVAAAVATGAPISASTAAAMALGCL